MAFADEVWKEGIGRVIRCDLSTDGFSTVAYRLGSQAGLLDGTNHYQARVISLGNVRRGFGTNRVAAGGTTQLVLDNSDGGLSALAGRANMSTQGKLRVRIYVTIYTPGTSPATFTPKLLGEFILTEWVRRTNATLTLQLGDDVMGGVSQQALLPTLAGWAAVGTTATNPLKDGFGRPDSLADDGTTPMQLAFGEDWVECFPHLIPIGTVDAAYQNKVIVPVCCTTDTGSGSSNDVTNLRIMWLDPNRGTAPRLIDVPKTVTSGSTTVTVWSVERSPTVTRNGRNFKIIYLVVRADLGVINLSNNYLTGFSALANDSGGYNPSYDSSQFSMEWNGGYPPTAIYQMRGYVSNNPELPQYASHAAAVLAWYAKGYPLSARTQTSAPIQHPVDVVTDLVTYYSAATVTVDSTQSARVKAAAPNAACAGVVQPWTERTGSAPPSLRQVITKICQSSDFDVFINWNGQFSFSSLALDLATAVASGSVSWTPGESTSSSVTSPVVYSFDDTRMSGVEEWIPSQGERNSIFNRLYFNGGKAYVAEGLDVPFQGPWDFETGDVGLALADRIIEGELEQGWRPWRQQAFAPWSWRQLDVSARPMVRFTTDISALRLELGDIFRLTWTAGDASDTSGAMYSAAAFQVESLIYAPGGDEVQVEAVWRGDINIDRQYLLDDETLLVRSKGALSGSAIFDGSDLVEFTGTINLTTMGVQAGDVLVLRSSAEADDAFTFNAAYRIGAVTSISVTVVGPGGAVPALSGPDVQNSEWSIVRGATTYPTAISDPTNYPHGGDIYGKVTDAGGEYSNAEGGNKLFNG